MYVSTTYVNSLALHRRHASCLYIEYVTAGDGAHHFFSTETMEDLYNLIQERNRRETLPFLSIHSSNAYLRNHVDTLQARCESLERQYLEQQQTVAEQQQAIELSSNSAPTKIEARLREQIAKLQEDLRERIQNAVKSTAEVIETSNELSKSKEQNAAQDATISNLRMELTRCNEIIAHLQSELENSKSLARLAGKQIDGLKDAIRSLQEENEEITKLNKRLLEETVSDKEKMADQLNNMNTTIESQRKEVTMLRSYAKLGKGLFRGLLGDKNLPASNADNSKDADTNPKRQWGENACSVLPSQPLYTIKAHRDDASCVRYDGTNLNRVATASSDATVKVFDTTTGQLEATFSAGGRQPLIGVDIGGGIVCGCGADKTCRVWHQQTKRMIHQLAGHSQKITCVRMFPGEKSIITGSADRSIRVWDISRHIYTQTTTFRHSSTSNCIDVSSETNSAVSGHIDGNYSVVFIII
jgi:autophagy-related protein 16